MNNLVMGHKFPWRTRSESVQVGDEDPELSRVFDTEDAFIENALGDRQYRNSFGARPGAELRGYPSQAGGVWVLEDALGVELDYLGLDRFQDTPRVPKPYVDESGIIVMPEDEDEWCFKRMRDPPPRSSCTRDAILAGGPNLESQTVRQLGAIWWEYERTYVYHELMEDLPRSKEDNEVIKVGYPATGGVWVLSLPRNEASRKGVGAVHNAYSMEERCRVIESLGGVFYANPDESPELDLKGEGRRSGRGGVKKDVYNMVP